jgi:hypothetical protein
VDSAINVIGKWEFNKLSAPYDTSYFYFPFCYPPY